MYIHIIILFRNNKWSNIGLNDSHVNWRTLIPYYKKSSENREECGF